MNKRVEEQLSLAEALVGHRLGTNARLERIEAFVQWQPFEKLLSGLHAAETGRPSYPPLAMFKALLLQQWYGLSDAELEEALVDRLSFRRFIGLGLEAAIPDHTTLCRFRNDLVAAGLSDRLFGEMARQLEGHRLVLKRGTLIDATLVSAAVGPAGSAEEAKDPDAAFARRSGKPGSTFGFKAHMAIDQGSLLVRAAFLTPANVNETVVADQLIQGDEKAVYADSAYDTKARRSALRARGAKDRIQHRPNKHHPDLGYWKKKRNKLIGRIRGRIEGTFGLLKRSYGYVRVRYIGLAKNQSHLHLLCIAINLRRASILAA